MYISHFKVFCQLSLPYCPAPSKPGILSFRELKLMRSLFDFALGQKLVNSISDSNFSFLNKYVITKLSKWH